MPRPKTPSKILKAKGTFRKDRHSDDLDAVAVPALPPAPDHLTQQQQALWDKIGQQLVDAGLLTNFDAQAFESLIKTYSELIAFEQQLGDVPDLVVPVGENGAMMAHPLVGLIHKWRTLLMRHLTQFGLTPSARTGIKLQQAQSETDPMAALIAAAGTPKG
jgi:P27 family predicted phage terminase small subunit